MPGSWQPLKRNAPVAVDTMLLLTDASVLCHEHETLKWHKLAPDHHGSYVNGTWHPVSAMPASASAGQNVPVDARFYFTSTVLRDGRVFVAGGECKGGSQGEFPAVEVYDPVLDAWTSAPNPPGFANIGDAPTCVLPDGRVLLGSLNTAEMAIFDPDTLTWSSGRDVPAASVDIETAIPMNDPRSLTGWALDGLLDFPFDPSRNLLRAFDAPACLLVDGKVLCAVGGVTGAGPLKGWSGDPVEFFEYDGAFLNPVSSPASVSHTPTYNCRLLPLPTGQVLLSNCTNDIEVYSALGEPAQAWRPHITATPRHLHRGHTYKLHGRQLNGLSQAVCYGEDAHSATNYPLLRLTRSDLNEVHFCRTFDHSTMAVATGSAIHHTQFKVPLHLALGEYEMAVLANGIASHPVEVRVEP